MDDVEKGKVLKLIPGGRRADGIELSEEALAELDQLTTSVLETAKMQMVWVERIRYRVGLKS